MWVEVGFGFGFGRWKTEWVDWLFGDGKDVSIDRFLGGDGRRWKVVEEVCGLDAGPLRCHWPGLFCRGVA